MFKFLMCLIFVILLSPTCFGIQEVVLDIDDDIAIIDERQKSPTVVQTDEEFTLKEKINNIFAREITDTSQSAYLLDEILTKEFESGIVKNVHAFGYVRSGFDMDFTDGDSDFTYDFSSLSAGVNGQFRDGKTLYEARFRFKGQNQYSFLQYMPSNIYIANTSIPHHTIVVGHTRTPVGHEGGSSLTIIPFVARSQISRNFGNTRKVGLRLKGNYSLLDYDIGGYSSDTYFRSFFPGAEFTGWLNFKPLGKTDGKYGKLTLGGGISAGQNHTNYFVSGLFAEYKYKNLFTNFEYAAANGYNGARELSTKHAEGFYTTLGYKITPKIQIVGRYDYFLPDKNFNRDIRREYSAGINYFIKGQAFKVMLNYVFCQNDYIKDSHRIILGTQILL